MSYSNPLALFNFAVLTDKNFKEDSVREDIIKPLTDWLGFDSDNASDKHVIRSLNLSHPFVKTGSGSQPIRIIPDYLFQVANKAMVVLDAKAPTEDVTNAKHQEQVYFYTIHPDIRAPFYGLCNGERLIIWSIDETAPRINLKLENLDDEKLHAIYSIFHPTHIIDIKQQSQNIKHKFDYSKCEIPKPVMKPKKQAKNRYFGVHGYFTKQSWDVVYNHITTFSQAGDVVLDPFGGSGITAIEATLAQRIGIHIDINPLCVFWAQAMLTPVKTKMLMQAGERVLQEFTKLRPTSQKAIKQSFKIYDQPQNIDLLSKGADVGQLYDLFTPKQRADLACLKYCIKQEKDSDIYTHLMLAFSSTVTTANLTYHKSRTGGGDTAVFRYYRYRIAPEPTFRDVADAFDDKLRFLIKAKNEINKTVSNDEATLKQSYAIKGNASVLPLETESVDYIYTDPPYGAKIHYLDLSVMWNAWLDFEVTEEDYQNEAIEGGSREKSRNSYDTLLTQSLMEMFRVLKWNRWMSFVFQHQDPHYWHVIVDAAERMGFEYMGTVRQSNGQTTFKKRQNPFTVLSGQLIIYFRKVKTPKARFKAAFDADIQEIVLNRIESLIAEYDGATLEDIYAALITDGLEMGYGDLLAKEYSDITPLMNDNYDYDEMTQKYHVRPKGNFKTHIDINQRVKYFLISYLRRENRGGRYPKFEDIVYDIMPQLKNGNTPENQTIRSVLEQVAHEHEDGWTIKSFVELGSFLQRELDIDKA